MSAAAGDDLLRRVVREVLAEAPRVARACAVTQTLVRALPACEWAGIFEFAGRRLRALAAAGRPTLIPGGMAVAAVVGRCTTRATDPAAERVALALPIYDPVSDEPHGLLAVSGQAGLDSEAGELLEGCAALTDLLWTDPDRYLG